MKTREGRVLIFDDEPAVGRSLVAMVERLSMEGMAVWEPEAFFGAVQEWRPTHILLDLIMPDMDGVEVLQELAHRDCSAVIGLSSGVGSRILTAAQRSAVEHGLRVTQVLPKPLTLDTLQKFLSQEPSEVGFAKACVARRGDEPPVTTADLISAVEENQFFLVYHPVIHCRTQMLKGFEVLVRWKHPSKGLIMPDRFIPLAENLGLIDAITEHVVRGAFRWYAGIRAYSDLTLSINISAKTFGNSSFPDELEAMARREGVPAKQVILEVTETAALEDELQALDLFTRLRVKGFQVSIDDFGTGNSSLSLLARLPFSEVKVDKSFAMVARDSDESRTIIKSTVDLSHSLALTVVTEGVEDLDTLQYLQEIGCDYAQGFYIARPVTGDQAIQWMLHNHRDSLG